MNREHRLKTKQEASDELARHTQEFLAKGGRIDKVARGFTDRKPKKGFNNAPLFRGKDDE